MTTLPPLTAVRFAGEEPREWTPVSEEDLKMYQQHMTAQINKDIADFKRLGGINTKDISDTYHTFGELYEFRAALTRACFHAVDRMWHAQWKMTGACNERPFKTPIWRSMQHSDGTMFDDMFIVGYGKADHIQITFHYHLDKWDEYDFAETLKKAPEWDGHTPADVLERLKTL